MFKKYIYLLPLIPLLLFFIIISSRFLLVDPPIFPDEAYFVDIANQKNQSGVQQSFLYEIPAFGQSIRAYSYPPLYTDMLSLWINLTGISVLSVRILSLFAGIGVIIIFYLYGYKKTSSIITTILLTTALMFYGPFGMASRIARMDQFLLLGLMFGLYILAVAPTKKVTYILAGIAATSALLFHSAGMLIIIILLLFILFLSPSTNKKNHILMFFIPITLGVCWWLIRYADRFDLVMLQTSMQYGYKISREALLNLLFKGDVLWRLRILLYMTLCSILAILGITRKSRILFVTSLVAFLTLLGVIYGKEQWYLLYIIIPFLLLFIALYEEHLYKNITTIALLFLILLNACSTIPYMVQETKTNNSYTAFINVLAERIPQNANILVSTLPDTTFGLWQKGYTNVHAVPHVSDPGRLAEYIEHYDYLIINVITNSELKQVLNTNTYTSETIESDGYTTELVKLK